MSPPRDSRTGGAALVAAVEAAVEAACARDPEAYADAVDRLALLDQPRVGVVLGAVVRQLLEQQHPDGLTGEAVGTVLSGTVRSAGWADADPDVLVTVLTGALGLLEAADQPLALSTGAVARHAPLLVAHLLATGRAPLAPSLAAALAELQRAETVELP